MIQLPKEFTNPIEMEYNDANNENDDNSPIDELPELLEEVREARNSRSFMDHDSDDFERLMNDAKKEAYPGCQKYSVLLYVETTDLVPNHLARPVENASLLATGIGIIIRRHAPVMNIKTYDDIPSQDKTQLRGALMAWFEFIDIETDPLVQDKLDDMLRTAFRHWKNTMHVAYNESKDAGRNPIDDCPYDWFERGVWKATCDSFEEPSFKRRSEKNKDNRSKLPYPHSLETQSFDVRYYRMAEEERSHVKNWRDCHTKKNGRMVNDVAELQAEEMDTRKRQRLKLENMSWRRKS